MASDILTFRLYIDTDNAAFGDDAASRNMETARILRKIADRLEAGEDFLFYQTLFDINGNDVGRAAFKTPEKVR
jgi:hypothetical protein